MAKIIALCFKCGKVIIEVPFSDAVIPQKIEVTGYCKDCIGFIDRGAMRAHALWKRSQPPYNGQGGSKQPS